LSLSTSQYFKYAAQSVSVNLSLALNLQTSLDIQASWKYKCKKPNDEYSQSGFHSLIWKLHCKI